MTIHLYEPGQEPERYELDESPSYQFGIDRRDFFRLLGAGLLILLLVDEAPAQETGGGRRRGGGRGGGGW